MRRIRFGGAGLAGIEWRGPAAHIKLVVPEEGRHQVPLPTPESPRPPTMRTYTPRRIDAAKPAIEIDFVTHGHGPAGRWATRAAVGDQLVMMGPAPGYVIDESAPWYLLLADDSALPAIETILEALPPGMSVRVLVEVTAEAEIRPLPNPGATVQWLLRGGDRPGEPLAQGLRALASLPPGDGRVYVGCESAALRHIRKILRQDFGIPPQRLTTRGYWKLGAINHTDHDYAEDDD
jgi:NADPH-dependent ferric siderophore reductase